MKPGKTQDFRNFHVRLIDEDTIPKKRRPLTDFLEMLRKIPSGKAMVVTEKELGIKANSVQDNVRRSIKGGLLPPTFKVMRRTTEVWDTGKTVTIYIVNEEAKP